MFNNHCQGQSGSAPEKRLAEANSEQRRQKLDSLWNVLSLTKTDTTRFKLFHDISSIYKNYYPDSAFICLYEAISIAEKLGDGPKMSQCYINVGSNQFSQGKYYNAIDSYLKALKIDEELGDKNNIAAVNGNIASLHIALVDSIESNEVGYSHRSVVNAHLDSALQYGTKSLELAQEIGALPWENSAANTLMAANLKLGNYKKAMQFAEIYINTKDSLFSEEKTKALAEMETKYEAEKKQLQIDNLSKENALNMPILF